jgi:hypothetical protein
MGSTDKPTEAMGRDAEDPADDTEGHSLPLVMGLDAIARSRDRARARKPSDEDLAPLTKPFPRLKRDRQP